MRRENQREKKKKNVLQVGVRVDIDHHSLSSQVTEKNTQKVAMHLRVSKPFLIRR